MVGRPPKSVRSLWTLLGYEPPRGVRSRAVKQDRWKKLLERAPGLARWLSSEDGLRAPAGWPQRLHTAWVKGGVPITPLAFAAACFPGRLEIAASYTRWRGMPELCAAAHGWRLTEDEVEEAEYAVIALCEHVPFVVYALCPDLTGVAMPASDKGTITRIIERQDFVYDPLGRAPHERRHAIDEEVWSAALIKALPRTKWVPCTKAVPVERSLVEDGVRGWRPRASRP